MFSMHLGRLTSTAIDLYHDAAILTFPIDIDVTKPKLEEQNSLVHICKMIVHSVL